LGTIFLLGLAAGPVAAGVPFPDADLSVTKSGTPNPVAPGGTITYTITVQNLGPDDAPDVNWSDAPPIGTTTFVSLTAPAGWSTTTPPVGGTGSVSALHANLTVAAGPQVFTLVVQVDADVADATLLDNFTSVVSASSNDPNIINNSFLAITTVAVPPAPVPSVPDAAMPEPASTNPAIPIGFAVILMAGLAALAVVNRRRSSA
jgi:uncharacterized repeat protein (TIGR01451 family)